MSNTKLCTGCKIPKPYGNYHKGRGVGECRSKCKDCSNTIDHIIPCASVTTKAELIALQHYTNLQYLYPKDNLQKSDKLDWTLT